MTLENFPALEGALVPRADGPRFSVRSRLFSGRAYVFAHWTDGRCRKVARFKDRQDAQDWIEVSSARWLEEHGS